MAILYCALKEALDIYIKLLIAIISFIAPLLINLLSVFSDGIAIKKKRFEEFENQTTILVKDAINQEGANVTKLIADNSSSFESRKKENIIQLELLDPKRQIKRIFPTFFYSLALIIINRLFEDSVFVGAFGTKQNAQEFIINISFIASIGFAIYGVVILYNVVWAIINVKQEIAEEKEKEQSKSDKITITQKKINK